MNMLVYLNVRKAHIPVRHTLPPKAYTTYLLHQFIANIDHMLACNIPITDILDFMQTSLGSLADKPKNSKIVEKGSNCPLETSEEKPAPKDRVPCLRALSGRIDRLLKRIAVAWLWGRRKQ